MRCAGWRESRPQIFLGFLSLWRIICFSSACLSPVQGYPPYSRVGERWARKTWNSCSHGLPDTRNNEVFSEPDVLWLGQLSTSSICEWSCSLHYWRCCKPLLGTLSANSWFSVSRLLGSLLQPCDFAILNFKKQFLFLPLDGLGCKKSDCLPNLLWSMFLGSDNSFLIYPGKKTCTSNMLR